MTRSDFAFIFPLALALAASSTALSEPAHAAQAQAAVAKVPDRVSLDQLRQRFGAADDRYVKVQGVELRYRDEGEGPVLLLLHGSRSTLNAWDGMADRLKDRYRVVRFDMPPTGLSDSLSDAAVASIGSPEKLVAGFLDALSISRVNITGVSSGGTLGYYFSASYPDRVENLILSNTPSNPVPDLVVERPADLIVAQEHAEKTGVEDMDFWSSYLTWLYGERSRLKPSLVKYYYETNLRVIEKNPFGLHALTANRETTMARLKAVRAPVMLVWGMRDQVLPPVQGAALYGYLENAQSRSFVALETVGHYPPMESPKAVADLVDAFIQRNR